MIERIQWRCPKCNRRYAIPATAPTPSQCPQCRQAAGEEARAAIPFTAVEHADEDSETTPPDIIGLSALAAIQLEVAEEAARGPLVATPVARHAGTGPTRKTLNSIAMTATVLSGLSVVGAFVGLLYGLRVAFVMQPNPARTMAIFEAIAALCCGLIAAFSFFAMREVIRLLLDIEENTRTR